jgi:hypothetical protein
MDISWDFGFFLLGIGNIFYVYQNCLHKMKYYYRCTCFLYLLRCQLLIYFLLVLSNLFCYIHQEDSVINYVSDLKQSFKSFFLLFIFYIQTPIHYIIMLMFFLFQLKHKYIDFIKVFLMFQEHFSWMFLNYQLVHVQENTFLFNLSKRLRHNFSRFFLPLFKNKIFIVENVLHFFYSIFLMLNLFFSA